MDNGEVIPGLNENWTFAGANAVEWMSGFMMFILSTELFDKISRSMPLLIVIWLATTFALSTLRNMFPDEERGMRNWLMTKAGMIPLNLPAPAELQPTWSGVPMHALPKSAHYQELKLDDMLQIKIEEKKTTDDSGYSRAAAGATKKI